MIPDDVLLNLRRQRAAVLGDTNTDISLCNNFAKMLIHFLACCAANSRVSCMRRLSVVWMLDKCNGKMGTSGLRLVRGILTIAKLVLSICVESVRQFMNPLPADFFFHTRGRSREEAIAIQRISLFVISKVVLVVFSITATQRMFT